MKNLLKYPLNLQLFAESGEPGGGGNQEPTPSVQNPQPEDKSLNIDYEKLAETLANRTSRSEESALKGILKEQGLSKEEMDEAIKEYKQGKQNKIKEEQERINRILQENNAYKQKELMSSIKGEAKKIALNELGVREDRFDKLMALCDNKKFVDEKGVINKEAIKAEFEEQLKDLPEFKKSAKRVTISASKGVQAPGEMSDEEEYRKRKYGKSKYFKG
ncbi:hypothetical protein [Longibaculum muris]|uniref:hypothetical protein n=1 Tax=Longibaculum muris TaxID=1796628 RepID=UPI0022E76ADF|nr:hypothetical protein [Longibaculum muris]